jgi:hypothetical protein
MTLDRLVAIAVRGGWSVHIDPMDDGQVELQLTRGDQKFVIRQWLDVVEMGGLRLSLERFIADGANV